MSSTDLVLIPLDDVVVFPHMNVTLPLELDEDVDRVLLVPRHEGAYGAVGTVAEVLERVRLPGGGRAMALAGLHRGVAGAARSDGDGLLRVDVEEHSDEQPADGRARQRARELEREYRAVIEEIL